MCGVAALFSLDGAFDPRSIIPMTRLVAHRGPDGESFACLGGEKLEEMDLRDSRARVALGHRRLSIIDLSDRGRQPMRRGHLWVTYNGEIFNFVEVREELEALGVRFESNSDTEVLLHAWATWGPACLARLRGMWGFVLVDVRARRAWFCRDRMGIKPLYVARGERMIGVSSEIKQLEQVRPLVPDDEAVGHYLQSGYEDPRRSFYAGVEPVPAGTWRALDLDSGELSAPEPYWFPERIVADVSDPDEAAARFDALFRDAVAIHMRSDVPVGCALSGGVDSSAVAAAVSELGVTVETFSATFPGFSLDESRWIAAVVDKVHAHPHEVSPTAAELLADIDRFLWCLDEPPGSLSQYAAYAVARLTRTEGVPVTLNGQGGDEVLLGYWQTAFASLVARPRDPLLLARRVLPAVLPGGNHEIVAQAWPMLRRYLARRRPSAHLRLRSQTSSMATESPALRALAMSEQERRVYEIRELTLPRLLKWDDRNFMAFGVEGRYPFLDHRVVEGCLTFKAEALLVAGWTKEPLRRAFAGRLPTEIVRRRGKIGFETPQATWARGAFRSAVASALSRSDSPLVRFVRHEDLRAFAGNGGRRGAPREESQALIRAFLADRWLRGRGIAA